MEVEPGLVTHEVRGAASRLKVVAFDFDGVFTDNGVYVFEDGREAVRCSRADGIGLRRIETLGIQPVVVSAEVNQVVARRCEKLRVRCFQGCVDKVATFEEFLAERGTTFEESAFVGNDVNDGDLLSRVALPIVVGDAHEEVLRLGRYRTMASGGHGAVREVCDMIVRCRQEREALP